MSAVKQQQALALLNWGLERLNNLSLELAIRRANACYTEAVALDAGTWSSVAKAELLFFTKVNSLKRDEQTVVHNILDQFSRRINWNHFYEQETSSVQTIAATIIRHLTPDQYKKFGHPLNTVLISDELTEDVRADGYLLLGIFDADGKSEDFLQRYLKISGYDKKSIIRVLNHLLPAHFSTAVKLLKPMPKETVLPFFKQQLLTLLKLDNTSFPDYLKILLELGGNLSECLELLIDISPSVFSFPEQAIETLFSLAEPIAEKGDTEMQFLLFYIVENLRAYKFRDKMQPKEEKSIEWATKAADSGHREACYRLAHKYFNTEKFEEQIRGLKYLAKAAEMGHPDAVKNIERYKYQFQTNLIRSVARSIEINSINAGEHFLSLKEAYGSVAESLERVTCFLLDVPQYPNEAMSSLLSTIESLGEINNPDVQFELYRLYSDFLCYFPNQVDKKTTQSYLVNAAAGGHSEAISRLQSKQESENGLTPDF